MATREQLERALINADKAGDVDAARILAAEIQKMRPPFMERLKRAAVPEIADEVTAVAAGTGKGVGRVGLNAQRYVGKGLDAVGADSAGQWLVQDAEQGLNKIEGELAPYRASNPVSAGGGELLGEILATAPVGSALAKLVGSAAPSAPVVRKFADALRSSGTRLGTPAATTVGGKAADLGIRALAGGAVGGISAGLVDPDQAGTGAIVGAAFPLTTAAAGAVGRTIGRAVRGKGPSPEVVAGAERARQLGIDIPADRLVDNKPLNAAAASLNYVPFSGRAGTEAKMQSQLNRALSRTFGQDSDNVTMALRKADDVLGNEFDRVLKSTAVKIDDEALSGLSRVLDLAKRELSEGDAEIIANQVDDLLAKAKDGLVDGQAAYNIKKTLDRIGRRKSNEAFYALELKGELLDALNRSLGPEAAEKFAKTRQQYGAMLTLEKLARNGFEGDISTGRLANLTNVQNPEIKELADIAAQFMRARESNHGAAQRIVAGGLAAMGGVFGPVPLAPIVGGAAAGRAANSALNSQTLRDLMLYGTAPQAGNALTNLLPLTGKALPVISAQ